MRLRSFDGMSLREKKVLVRVDFNVPMKNGKVVDDTRIRTHLETLGPLKEAGAAVTLVSHLGRPKGKRVDDLSLAPVSESLRVLTGWDVGFIGECVGDEVTYAVKMMRPGEINLLENIRFYPGEEANDTGFSERLAKPFD
ncbi:MAG: phosphoglycerate kinase, partial [Thermovirgaceae bacterium]|nr:phosphoglycerate kinase [Thermovirgaceae bacterium]